MTRRPYELRQTRWCYRVSWQAHAGLFDEMLDDWRRSVLPRCRGTVWLPEEKCWHLPSVPAYKFRVVAFLERWYDDLVGVNCTPDLEHETLYHGDDGPGPHAPPPPASQLGRAYATLHLLSSAPLWAAEAVYKAGSRVAHPDAGGSHAAQLALNEAIAVIRQHADREPAARAS